MPIAYIIHASEDTRFVEQHLVVPLPVLGFDAWVSERHLAGSTIPQAQAMAASGAILAVVSAWAARSMTVKNELEQAAQAGRRVIPVCVDDTPVTEVLPGLESLVAIDLRRDPAQPLTPERVALSLRPRLATPASVSPDAGVHGRAATIAWNSKVCSALLERAVAQHDYGQSDELVARLAEWLQRSGVPYDVEAARQDLGTLRRQRQFPLMLRYASAALESGIADPNVLRQYAQALIELGKFDHAIGVLHHLLAEIDHRHTESYEARGLLGRAYKQMYVNATGFRSASLLLAAIAYYYDAFREDQRLLWHGINAATCIRRAERDLGMTVCERPERIAQDVLETLNRLAMEKPLDAWDLATRVEALVVVGDFDTANRALTEYLQHPEAHAFEVSSTHRQFEQVLQLQDDDQGKALVARLWEAVERHRAPLALRPGDPHARVSVLVSINDPSWTPTDAGTQVRARLGTVVAVECDPPAIKSLLNDPIVLGITESRRTGDARECARSVPFIRVAESYPSSAGGTFKERGRHALVAIIDDGIDVLHKAFLGEDGKSRILGVWDQRDASGPPPPGFTFGTYHNEAKIAEYIDKQKVPPKLGRNEKGHGTHVASIAAGRPAGAFAGGVAQDARLLMVIADAKESIGYSTEHMAALEFIGKKADESNLPVVVNVSQGMNAGAHDGLSPLETAFDIFSANGSKPGRVIVKSAGNAGSANGHASLQVSAGVRDKVQWRRYKDPDWEYEYLEFWWNSEDAYEFTLVSPSGERSEVADVARAKVSGALDHCPYQIRLVRRDQYNGDSQLVIEIGSADGNTAKVPAGPWTLEIKHVEGYGNAVIDGWIERGPAPPSQFQGPHLSNQGTLSVPGTAQSVITVGAIEAADDDTIVATPFTSYGPTRDDRKKPEISAPGANVVAAEGGTTDSAFADDGTSMAAPHVAGAVALLLSRAKETGKPMLTAAQIRRALQQKTRNRNPKWNPAQGFGVIDTAALLAAFE